MDNHRGLKTRKGEIRFPAYVPVTTFGGKYPLDGLIRPYLSRLAPALMVSYYYARQMGAATPSLPLWVDSGGFVSLFTQSTVEQVNGLGIVRIAKEDGNEHLEPHAILDFQEQVADVAFTLDFPIPPGMDRAAATQRQDLTIANALWALANRRRRDLPLYACVQAWDAASARACAQAYAGRGFDGIAIGGLVPRAQDTALIRSVVDAVRGEIGELPLHVFGLGKPETTRLLYEMGVDSVDSSSYVKLAAEGRLWSDPHYRIHDASPTDRLQLALCNLATATGSTLPLSALPRTYGTLRQASAL